MKKSAVIQEFADELKNQMGKAGKASANKKVQKILHDTQLLSEINARLAKEIEFLNERQINVATFLERYEEIEKEFESKLARESK